jgi:small subunit ribosomal protein S4
LAFCHVGIFSARSRINAGLACQIQLIPSGRTSFCWKKVTVVSRVSKRWCRAQSFLLEFSGTMGRYTGPKGRINRRLGMNVYESAGAIKASEKKEFPPGMHKRRKKPTTYGAALAEKQKIKFYYGLRDRQLFRYFDIAKRTAGNTGTTLLILCERRLDNVVRRAGFTLTRPQARQGIVHRHFQLNGKTVNKPGIMVKPGDVITLRNRPNIRKLYNAVGESANGTSAEWINFDKASMKAIVTTLPTIDDVMLKVEVGQVVVFMSR